MADAIRNYFDQKVPIAPGEGRLGGPGGAPRTWQQAWNNLSRQSFVTMPNQLDRCRVNRNKFIKAVQ